MCMHGCILLACLCLLSVAAASNSSRCELSGRTFTGSCTAEQTPKPGYKKKKPSYFRIRRQILQSNDSSYGNIALFRKELILNNLRNDSSQVILHFYGTKADSLFSSLSNYNINYKSYFIATYGNKTYSQCNFHKKEFPWQQSSEATTVIIQNVFEYMEYKIEFLHDILCYSYKLKMVILIFHLRKSRENSDSWVTHEHIVQAVLAAGWRFASYLCASIY